MQKKSVFITLKIGRYERDEARPTIDILKRIAQALHTTVGYLLGENNNADLFKDPSMLNRFKDIANLDEEDKSALLRNIDAYLRETKTRKAYA